MTREALANAFDKAAEAFAELAHELRANEPSVARADVAASVPTGAPVAAGVAPSAPAARPVTECPRHGKPFTPSKNPDWPSYCTSRSEEPAPWSNDKGYCRINSKNAAEWLAVRAAAPVSDEMPF
jgi:hypothetical protein